MLNNGEMGKLTDHLYLNVGVLHNYSLDQSLVLERARRGVESMGVTWSQIIAQNRRGRIAETRHMVSKYLRDSGFSYPEIADAVQRANHTTSVYAVRRCNELIETYPEFAKNYEKFITQ